MPAHPKTEVSATISRDGVVLIYYDADIEVVKEVARRLVAGGLSTIEFTNRGAGALRVLAELIGWAQREGPELVVGVGTVTQAATAVHAIDLGVDFVVRPNLHAETATVCNERNVPYVPGCATLSEIQQAYRLGCDLGKLFPADTIGGPAFLEAIRAPCPWVKGLPSGGVEPTVASLKAWYDAGAPAVVMGSKLLPRDLIASGDWDMLERKVAQAVEAVTAARSTE